MVRCRMPKSVHIKAGQKVKVRAPQTRKMMKGEVDKKFVNK